uniref:Uncharacterized protein n=1 Tax=Cucumis sativus TaxID=3659 RepID=A0A0A0LQP5_CUCSA
MLGWCALIVAVGAWFRQPYCGARRSLEIVAETVEERKEFIIGLCVSSAIGIVTTSVQIKTKLPNSFQCLSMPILLCFVSVVFARMIESVFRTLSEILYCVGDFMCATTCFIATAISYDDAHFHTIVIVLYSIFCIICIIFIIFISITHNDPSSPSSSNI